MYKCFKIITHTLFLLLCNSMLLFSLAIPLKIDSCAKKYTMVELYLSLLLQTLPQGVSVVGKPQIIDCKYGKALQFDGQKDAVVIDTNLLLNMHQFTIEVIMRPDTNGQREQRFLHFGEVRGERTMIETRLTRDDLWYLDTYIKSGESGKTLADSTKLHKLNKWYHIAFTVDAGKMIAYVNGSEELEGQIPFSPFTKGQTSIGGRLNRVNWYKGAIYKLRITPCILQPNDFLKY